MKILLSFFAALAVFASVPSVDAATLTVCASGCAHTTIASAFAAASEGDVVQVNGGGAGPYSAASESFDLFMSTASTTLTCINGATIGQPVATAANALYLATSSTVSDCAFSNVDFRLAGTASGFIIADNTFATAATGTITLTEGASLYTISGNTNLNSIHLLATSTSAVIENNTFYGSRSLNEQGMYLQTSPSSSSLTIRGNTFYSRATTAPGGARAAVALEGEDLTFASNTIIMVNTPPTSIEVTVLSFASGTVTIAGNKIETPVRASGDNTSCSAVTDGPLTDVPWVQTLRFTNNTIRGRCDRAQAISLSDSGYASGKSVTGTISRNIFYAAGSSKAAINAERGGGNVLSITNTNNGLWGYRGGAISNVASSNVTEGSGWKRIDPFLRLDDADTTNDLDVAPFSAYLDYTGTADIGATIAARRSTVYVDDNGTIDYSSVDANQPVTVTSTVRSGDTLSLAAGSYGGFAISSSYVTTSFTIVGAGASTVINAETNQDALRLTNVTSSAVSNLIVKNASSTAAQYLGDRLVFEYSASTYGDAVPEFGLPANSMLVVGSADCGLLDFITADQADFSAYVGDGTEDFDIAMIQVDGNKESLIVRHDIIGSGAALGAACGGMGITVDKYLAGALVPSSGDYFFQTELAASEGIALSSGSVLAIDGQTVSYAGIKLDGSYGVNISNVTSTVNGYGVWFSSGTGNTLVDSVLSSSTLYDVRQGGSATNTLDNVTFTRVSSTVDSLAGSVLVKFRARVQAYQASAPGTGVSDSAVSVVPASFSAVDFGSTDGDGYTEFIRIPAYRITSAGAALTNGGYNAHTVSAGSVTGYAASSTTATISSRNQTVTIAMVSNVLSTAPSGAAAASVTATGATVSWTDNADDETEFLFGYATTSQDEAFPGTTATLSADAVSNALTGLLPNYIYQARVAAVNGSGTSAYSTTSAFTTLAAVPGAPTLGALSVTTASVAIDPGANSTSTKYALYNTTDGVYVGASGAASSVPAWLATSTWASVTVNGLVCNAVYGFVNVARNLDGLETATSSIGRVTTSACPSSGGGGGGGSSFGSPLPSSGSLPVVSAPATPLPPIFVTFLDRNAPVPTAPAPAASPIVPAALPAPSASAARAAREIAAGFGLPLAAAVEGRLGRFIEAGTSAETRALGSGERQALLRDAMQTIGRTDVPDADLERLARGEIPGTRNLALERQLAPRALATFRTIYGQAPDFRVPAQNLAWNTLMYRIRFPRDLAAERDGIRRFRSTFGRAPQDPFQWAAVRVLGYVAGR